MATLFRSESVEGVWDIHCQMQVAHNSYGSW